MFKKRLSKVMGMFIASLLPFVLATPVLAEDTSISITLQAVEDGDVSIPKNGVITAYQLTDSYAVDEDGNYTFHYLDESFDGASASEIEFAIDNGNTSYAASFDEMIGSDGTLKFSGIPYGVYLISQTIDSAGFNRMNPVLVTICDMSNAEYIGDHVIIEPKIELKTAIKRPPTVDTTTGDGSESEQPTGGNSIGGGNTSGGLQADTSISIALQSVEDGTRYYPENGTLTAYQLTDSYVVDEDGNYTFHYLNEAFKNMSAAEIESTVDNNGSGLYVTSVDQSVGTDGTLKFSNLPYGVYLISQTKNSSGFSRMNPTLVTICDMSNAEYIGDHVIIEPKIEVQTYFPMVVPTGIQQNVPIFTTFFGFFAISALFFYKFHAGDR